MKKIKMIGIIIAIIIGVSLISIILFMLLSPQFGRTPSKEQKHEYSQYSNFKDGKFQNSAKTEMNPHYWSLLKEMMDKKVSRKPNKNVEIAFIDNKIFSNTNDTVTQLIWFGHSSFLLIMNGKYILIDPMLGESPSPTPLIGSKRYSEELPIQIENLPFIDAVILSHDHYDHLDYESIKKLEGKVGKYFTPLGVGNHLISWGVDKEIVSELNWWESINFDSINLVCTPSQHFSGRGIFDRETTLWCSWIIESKNDKIFFSGDSGYDTHFKEIGDKFGPFDISLMECGQYHDDWKMIHMTPEESVQASVDLKSKLAMPIHWGAFTLALHDWTDPIERFIKKAKELNVNITTPVIGIPIRLDAEEFPKGQWWREYKN